MSSSKFNSIFLNGKALRPAPFVSTSYEYIKSGQYTIGGLLVVTLSGTLVGEDIIDQIVELNSLQSSQDCIQLIIGCSGESDFLNGSGRIASIDISQDNEPYLVSYSIVINIETINGQPAVSPDPDFARSIGISEADIPLFLKEYLESITIDGTGDIISSHDKVLSVSKSNIKISGSIKIKINANYICNLPSRDPSKEINNFLKKRSTALLNGIGDNNPIAKYIDWNKMLDTKSLEIENDGSVSWQFDAYILPDDGVPLAFVDINTTDKLDQKTQRITRTISGTINGLSSATIDDHIGHKTDVNERISNAENAFATLETYLINGTWPGDAAQTTGIEGSDCDGCESFVAPKCYQRISHNIASSPITGLISFDMDFADITSCQDNQFDIETTIDESLPANIFQEIIIPARGKGRSIVQVVGGSSTSVSIIVRGNLKGCDTKKMNLLISNVRTRINNILNREYRFGWFIKKQNSTLGTYSYSENVELVRCDL